MLDAKKEANRGDPARMRAEENRDGKAQKRFRTGASGCKRRPEPTQSHQLLRTRLPAHRRPAGQLRTEARKLPDSAGAADRHGLWTDAGAQRREPVRGRYADYHPAPPRPADRTDRSGARAVAARLAARYRALRRQARGRTREPVSPQSGAPHRTRAEREARHADARRIQQPRSPHRYTDPCCGRGAFPRPNAEAPSPDLSPARLPPAPL